MQTIYMDGQCVKITYLRICMGTPEVLYRSPNKTLR